MIRHEYLITYFWIKQLEPSKIDSGTRLGAEENKEVIMKYEKSDKVMLGDDVTIFSHS